MDGMRLAKRKLRQSKLLELTLQQRSSILNFFQSCIGFDDAANQLFMLLVDNCNSDACLELGAPARKNCRQQIFEMANSLLSVCSCDDQDRGGNYNPEHREDLFIRFWCDTLVAHAWRQLRSKHKQSCQIFNTYWDSIHNPERAKHPLPQKTHNPKSQAEYNQLIASVRKQFAQQLIHQVKETLLAPTASDIEQELDSLRLTSRLDILPTNHSDGERSQP